MSKLNKFFNKRQKDNPKGEMSFIDHIEELRWHIVRSFAAIIIAAIVAFIYIDSIFHNVILGPARPEFVSYRAICWLAETLHIPSLCMEKLNIEFQNTIMSGQFMMSFSVSFMVGFIIAFPYVLWELWRFIKPALSQKEIQSARGIVFWSSALFFTGVLFAYFIIAPFTINFFAGYTLSPMFKNIITIDSYYDSMLDLVLGIGLVFELPVIVYFLSRIGLLTPHLMRSKRSYAILIIIILAAIITPPDIFSLWLVTLPLFILYQVSIVISERAHKELLKKRAEDN